MRRSALNGKTPTSIYSISLSEWNMLISGSPLLTNLVTYTSRRYYNVYFIPAWTMLHGTNKTLTAKNVSSLFSLLNLFHALISCKTLPSCCRFCFRCLRFLSWSLSTMPISIRIYSCKIGNFQSN